MFRIDPSKSIALVGALAFVTLTLQEQAGQRQHTPGQTNQTSSRPLNQSSFNSARPPLATAQQQQQSLSRRSDNSRQLGESNHSEAQTRILDDLSHRLDQPAQDVSQDYDTRLPFWNIAHMINSIEQIELALRAGANGIETDVSFDARGRPVEAYHGFPCDCGRHCHHREEFVEFVRHLARLTVPPGSSRLFVVLFDLKLKELKTDEQRETAGRALAQILHGHLYEPYQLATGARNRQAAPQANQPDLLVKPALRVVLSINHASDIALVKAFNRYTREHRLDFMSKQVGFDVGMNDKLSDISAAWDSLNGAAVNIWQGDGLTNCANIVRGVERLREALAVRNGQGHFRKVYYWTADVMYHIRSVLRLGIDAVLTNQPQRVNRVLEEEEFRHKFRLATPWDEPFEQFWVRPSGASLKPPTLGETVETLVNIQKTSQNFIKTIPDGITAVVKKVQHSVGL